MPYIRLLSFFIIFNKNIQIYLKYCIIIKGRGYREKQEEVGGVEVEVEQEEEQEE